MNHLTNRSGLSSLMSIDTTFVLFFLAIEYGRSIQMFSLDGVLMGTTMLMVLALPYFLPTAYEKPLYATWLSGRGAIALFGMILGLVLKLNAGTLLPQSLLYVPMTFLILASMISCYIQFYSLMKLRPAK